MAAAVVTASLEHVDEADEVSVDVSVRIDQRMPHPRLGGEMHDQRKAMFDKQRRRGGTVGKVEARKREVLGAGKHRSRASFNAGS